MPSLLFATTNPGKLKELNAVSASFYGLTVTGISELTELGPAPHVVEGLETYEGNARLKAVAYSRWAARPCIADDTGLEVDALHRRPGVYTARYGFPRFRREVSRLYRPLRARFVCSLSYAEPNGRVVSATATLPGRVEKYAPDGEEPFHPALPYSVLFVPDGEAKTLNRLVGKSDFLSHRGRAFQLLMRLLGESIEVTGP